MFNFVKSYKKGFTLIEVIIVITILAILMLIAIGNFSGSKNKAKNTSVNSELTILLSHLNASCDIENLTIGNFNTDSINLTNYPGYSFSILSQSCGNIGSGLFTISVTQTPINGCTAVITNKSVTLSGC